MPNRVKISTKTTRNEEFNRYTTGTGTQEDPFVTNSVTSMTASKINSNIKLLDVNEAIIKKGNLIAEDSFNNTTIIEADLKFDTKTSLKLRDFAIYGRPDPVIDSKGAAEYDKYKAILENQKSSYEKVAKMVINYKDGDWMNKDAGIKFNSDTNYYIYGAPEQVILNNRQHYNNCGVEATLNNLAMAGIITMKENLKDQESIEKSFFKSVWERNLADDHYEVGVLNKDDGGTLYDDYRDIFEYFGIKSKAYFITTKSDEFVYPKTKINELAYKISQGHGAVLGLCSDILWNDVQSETGTDEKRIDHAIAITGVVYDTDNPTAADNPVGFYIHDTGAWMTRFISYDELLSAALCDYVYGPEDTDTTLSNLKTYDSRLDIDIKKEIKGIFITITDEPIKINTFNLNVTGDKYDNMLWGNNSDNTIKGMKGNDTLYGRAGNDTIYGGTGNDIIVGNEAYKLRVKNDMETIIYKSNTISDFKEYIENEEVKAKLDNIEITDYGTLTVDEFINLENIIPKGINTLYGDAGNDIIIGGEFADLIYGGNGNDYIWGGYGRNAVYGGAGNDLIIGGYDNDRLFGDTGNDYIYGLEDDDVINAGAGNDYIWGGTGNDLIETGKGNDTVYFEGVKYGQDEIYSQGGSTLFTFIDGQMTDDNASYAHDMFFALKENKENKKTENLEIKYTLRETNNDESSITFNQFLTTKSGKAKTLYLDAADGIFNVTVSNKSKATVANTKTTGTTKVNGEKINNAYINNILLTTNENGTTITTSKKDDIVTMCSDSDTISEDAIDKIIYTGGIDKYVSEARNTYYTAGEMNSKTNLAIYDNVIGIKLKDNPNYVSIDDRLYLDSEKEDGNYLFDVGLSDTNAITTEFSGLYLLNGTNYADIVKGKANGGFIYMDSFLKYDEKIPTQITGDNFYGNGQIEGLYFKDSEDAYDYTTDLTTIASNVAGWLSDTTYNPAGYNSAFDAFNNFDSLSEDAKIALIGAYSLPC